MILYEEDFNTVKGLLHYLNHNWSEASSLRLEIALKVGGGGTVGHIFENSDGNYVFSVGSSV